MKLPGLSKKATRIPAMPRRQEPSLWPFAGVLILLVICALAAAAWAGADAAGRSRQQAGLELAQRDARLYASQLGNRLQSGFAGLAVIAQDQRVAQAFAEAEASRLADLQAAYQPGLPGVLRLAFLPAGLDKPDLRAEPPIGYAVIEMLRAAERDQKAPPPEVHLSGQPGAHVNLVQPVLGADGVAGHLLASYPVSWLQQALNGSGSISLLQAGVSVMQRGARQEGVQVRAAVPASNWQLVYSAPVAAGPGWSGFALPGLLAGVLALVIAGMFFLMQRRLKRLDFDSAPEPARQAPLQPRDVTPPDPAAGIKVDTVPAMETEPAPAKPKATPKPESKPASTAPGLASGTTVDPRILRAYDVRGIVGDGLSAEVVHAFGRAIATEAAAAGQQEVVVARDGRLSSPELSQALIDGLVAGGRQVVDIGQVPTPVMHFATFHLETGAGVMVTGSHNPRDYNGLKIAIGGRTLSGDDIQKLGQRVERGDFISGEGSVRHADVLMDYIDRITQDVTLHRPLRIVIDCGNGVAGAVAPQVFRAMGCEVEELFCEVDGYFPNHHPDPTVPANLDALISLVRLQGADLGLAFDGDGDRLGVVDGRGNIIWPDRQMMLLAREVLMRSPGSHVVFDVKCSAQLAQFVTEHAGVPLMWKSGHSMIRSKMQEVGALLAGDMSGHIFLADRWYGFDDAIYAGARVLEILSADGRSSADLFAELPDMLTTPEIRVHLNDGEAERIMDSLGEGFANSFSGARVTTVDGVRVDLADSWALVRASNTEPCLVLRFEGSDQEAMERIQEAFRSRLLAIKPDLQLPF
jgi:phosphomannomutase/phosphoglucomutase